MHTFFLWKRLPRITSLRTLGLFSKLHYAHNTAGRAVVKRKAEHNFKQKNSFKKPRTNTIYIGTIETLWPECTLGELGSLNLCWLARGKVLQVAHSATLVADEHTLSPWDRHTSDATHTSRWVPGKLAPDFKTHAPSKPNQIASGCARPNITTIISAYTATSNSGTAFPWLVKSVCQ